MNDFFRKENMLNAVFFSALLLMVIVKTFINSESLKEITFVISILLLIWSLMNLSASILEEINDVITNELVDMENCEFDYNNLNELITAKLKNKCTYVNAFLVIQKFSKEDVKNFDCNSNEEKDLIVEYWKFAKKRQKIRKLRRIFIFASCVVLILILAYLLLANDINKYLPTYNYDLTIWSLIIVFFEFTIKKPLTNVLIDILIKREM